MVNGLDKAIPTKLEGYGVSPLTADKMMKRNGGPTTPCSESLTAPADGQVIIYFKRKSETFR